MFTTVLRPLGRLTAALAVLAAVVATGVDRESLAGAASVAPAPRETRSLATEENPRVAPGLVKWHSSFAEAQAAATKSGKPVLLFHMMGQLDRQFC